MLLTLVSISSIKGTCLSISCTYHVAQTNSNAMDNYLSANNQLQIALLAHPTLQHICHTKGEKK